MSDTTWVTSSADLAGILPVVISGNRPKLEHRSTHRLLSALHGVTAPPVWVIREDRAPAYERDGHEVVTYGVEEAERFASQHWLGPEVYRPGGFLGCFTEREWACRTAEARGYWAVLQLDDNILQLRAFTGYATTARAVEEAGGLAYFADILASVTLGTNSRMTGAKLSAVNPRVEAGLFARAGFPYSLYLERVDRPGREPYFGPIEEDILHAYQYAARTDDATACLVYPIEYTKEHVRSAGTGMRPQYRNQRRSAGLQSVAPELAEVTIMRSHSNGRGGPRVFHHMNRGALRTPLVITDRERFEAARSRVVAMRAEVIPRLIADSRVRAERRAARAERSARLRAYLASPRDEAEPAGAKPAEAAR